MGRDKLKSHGAAGSRAYVVILVGGKGKRLRPLSTDLKPKAFLSVTRDRKTMFAHTVDRAKKLVPSANIVVVANRRHSGLVRKDFPEIKKDNLILEPVSRNTAPAIALAAVVLGKRQKDPVMVILPTDQYVSREQRYIDSIRRGIDFAKDNHDALLVMAVRPGFPSTHYGYIRVIGSQGHRVQKIVKIEKFTEKPGLATAKKYVASGRYLWNAGGFIFRMSAILRAVKRFAPRITDCLKDIDDIGRSYRRMPDISIDYAVMEKAENIYCVKGSYGWQDMGSFRVLASVLKRESRDFIVKGGKIAKII